MTLNDYFFFESIEIHAAKEVYFRFGVRRHELHALGSLACYLHLHERRVVSAETFYDWLGGNREFNRRLAWFIESLVSQGLLHRLKFRNVRPDRTPNSLAISSYGLKVLQAYYGEVEKIDIKHKKRHKLAGIDTLAVHSENLPKGYTLHTAGRDD